MCCVNFTLVHFCSFFFKSKKFSKNLKKIVIINSKNHTKRGHIARDNRQLKRIHQASTASGSKVFVCQLS